MNSNNSQQNFRQNRPLAPLDTSRFSMDIGLTKITSTANIRRIMRLPLWILLDPSEGRMEERLRQILDLSTFNIILVDVLRPKINDRKLLLPNIFRSRLMKLKNSVRKQLESPDCLLDPDLEDILLDLERQIIEEEDKNELLEQYRLMILMG